jgi:chromosome segregation ATPase
MNKVYGESSDNAAKLATETQRRLGLEERIATLKQSLRDTEQALDAAQARADDLERQRTDEDTSIAQIEGSSKRQILERNQLLVLVAQHMAKILSNDDSPSASRNKLKDTDPKPSTDFGAFHGLLTDRIRKLADLKLAFEKRAAKMQGSFTESFANVKKQQDSRGRQLERLEHSLKTTAEKQAQWRSRVVAKQNELEAAKGTISELQSQISSLKTRSSLASPGDNSKLTSLTSRANLAEKKMQGALREVQMAEERLSEAKSKYAEGENKWMARIRELEARCKAAEEKVKRERQGAKERVAEQQEQRR